MNENRRVIGIIRDARYGNTAIIIVLFTILLLQSASGQSAGEAARIMKKSRDAVMVNSFEAVSILSITDEKGRYLQQP